MKALQLLREPGPPDVVADRFVLEGEAGVGGMGIVYRAHDSITDGVVALKVLRKADPASTRRFASEVEALERLSDPAIVKHVAHGILDDGRPYLAMEWVEGESLSERLGKGPLAISEALDLGIRIGSALRVAHAMGIVHRDIKPSNVLLPDGVLDRALVGDFGLSRFVGEAHASTVGIGLGTPGYASPEQLRGAADLDGRADLFSLGCLLFRCLTGAEAFEGAEALTVIAKLVLEEPRRVRSLRQDVPPALDDLVARLLAKDRDERPPSADAVLAALEAVRAGLGDGSALREGSARSGEKRRGRAIWLFAALGALGLGVFAWAFMAHTKLYSANVAQPLPASFEAPAASQAPEAMPAKAIRITDLPASPSCRPDAVLDYREGLQALRETTQERAFKSFERAMGKDPMCPEILLRVLQSAEGIWPVAEQREHLRRTLAHRDALGERDRVVLDAQAAAIASDPPDVEASFQILSEGARRFPRDAELAFLAAASKVLLAKTPSELEAVLELARRAIELDPTYASAWLILGWTYERLGRADEEESAYIRCLEASPAAVSCLRDHITLLRRSGQCEEAEHVVRQWIARDPSSARAYHSLAAVATSLGAPREGIEEILRMRWAHLPEPASARNEVVRLHDRAKLAAWTGDFTQAIALGEAIERRIDSDPHIEPHLRGARTRIDALLETGKSAEAGALAEQFLRRTVAWTNSPSSGDRTESGATYFEPLFLGVAVDQGRLSPADWRAAASAWEHKVQTATSLMVMRNPYETWVLRWGSAAGAHIDPAEAMEHAPSFDAAAAPLPTFISFYAGLIQAYEGRLRLVAGDSARAAPLLKAAAESCQGLDQPFLNTRVHYWSGLAQEKLGHVQEACDAYALVERRWGHAVPRSVTAMAAAQHRRSLGCGD